MKDSGAYCGSGGCGKRNTYDWMSQVGLVDVDGFDLVEVSFKKGVHKEFYHNPSDLQAVTGDMVVVENGHGYDIGKITLSGEMVKLQMLKKKVKNNTEFSRVKRFADKNDLLKLEQARGIEISTMIRARAIVNSLGLDMKIGDVRYQGDLRQATFYYIAEGRVDFRELIKVYAQDFKIRVRMHQIGARQESALIGGLGSCGRELCCSTWLTDLKSVSTAALRYQNLSFNQSKLSGQCGRLKCCLNYELDFYVDATREFPKRAKQLKTGAGIAKLVKTDIFRKVMYYTYEGRGRGKLYGIAPDKVKTILEMNRKGEEPATLVDFQLVFNIPTEEETWDYENVGDIIELPPEERKKKRRKNRRRKNRNTKSGGNQKKSNSSQNKGSVKKEGTRQDKGDSSSATKKSRRPAKRITKKLPPKKN